MKMKIDIKPGDIVLVRKNNPNSKWMKVQYVREDNEAYYTLLIYNEFDTGIWIQIEKDKDLIIPYNEDTDQLENTTRKYIPLEYIKPNDLVLVSNELDNENYTWTIGKLKLMYSDIEYNSTFVIYDNCKDSTRYYRYCIPYVGNEDKLNKVAKKEDITYEL